MKSLFTALSVFFCSLSSHAVRIESGKYNNDTGKIDLTVSYSGGCAVHRFALQMKSCQDSFHVRCDIDLIHAAGSEDPCEAYITETVELDLPSEILIDQTDYYDEAILTILGSFETSFTFQLPPDSLRTTRF